MKRDKIIYWIFMVLFALSMLAGAILYFVDYSHAVEEFEGLGFPAFIIYPLAIAKILGVVGVLQNKSEILKEWAYAGFFFNLLLAFSAHWVAKDGEAFGPILVMVFMFGAYFFNKKIENE
jgi:hypothetical protein